MKPVRRILIKLDDFKVKLGDQEIYIDKSYNPQEWVSTKGTVVSTPYPEVKEGDIVYLDYFNVLQVLGRQIDPGSKGEAERYIIKDGQVYVFMDRKTIFFVERDGEYVGVNGFELITPIRKPKSNIILLKTTKEDRDKDGHVEGREYGADDFTNMAVVETGELKGKTVFYKKGMFRRAGRYGFNSKDFYVIHSGYILAEVENDN